MIISKCFNEVWRCYYGVERFDSASVFKLLFHWLQVSAGMFLATLLPVKKRPGDSAACSQDIKMENKRSGNSGFAPKSEQALYYISLSLNPSTPHSLLRFSSFYTISVSRFVCTKTAAAALWLLHSWLPLRAEPSYWSRAARVIDRLCLSTPPATPLSLYVSLSLIYADSLSLWMAV